MVLADLILIIWPFSNLGPSTGCQLPGSRQQSPSTMYGVLGFRYQGPHISNLYEVLEQVPGTKYPVHVLMPWQRVPGTKEPDTVRQVPPDTRYLVTGTRGESPNSLKSWVMFCPNQHLSSSPSEHVCPIQLRPNCNLL